MWGVGGISALQGFESTFVKIFSKFAIFRSVFTRLTNLCQILLLTFLLKGRLVPDNVVTLSFSLSVKCAGLMF